MGKRKRRAGGGGEDSGGGGRVKVYLHAVTNDEATLLTDNGNTRPLQEVKNQSRASEVEFHLNQSVTGMRIIIIRGTPKQIEEAVRLISQKTGSQETISDRAQKFFLQWVQDAFPDLDSRAYFLPPVYFNRVPMIKQTVSGEDVLMLNTHHGQSSQSNQPTPREGVEGSSEQELPRHAGLGIQPTLPEDEYQDTQPTLPGQTIQCIQPTPAEQPCNSNQRTPPEHFSQVSQLTPDHKASCSNFMTPPEQSSNYKQVASPINKNQCIQLTLPRKVSHYNETSHNHNDQIIQTSPGQSDQSIQTTQPKQTGNQLTQPGHTGQHNQAGPRVSVHQPPNVQQSDVRDDAAKQRVLVCLQEFSEKKKEVLVGMSQLLFGQYLGEPVYAAAAAHLPRAENILKTSSNTTQTNITQGSYDVLLIHRQYGFVVCEVRAFGAIAPKISMSQQDIDNNIRQKLRDAVSQLDKAEAMLSHLVFDIAPGLRITKTIAFPNLTADQVQQAISGDIPLIEDLCRCLGTTTTDPAAITGLCLCCDQLSDPKKPYDVSSHVLRELGHWWQRRVAGAGPDSHMTDVVYKMLVARFCGPATTVSVPCTCPPRVSVKTLGQAVWCTGECYTAVITLFPEQLHLLHTQPPTLFVTGPPGTGKTVVLLLMAIQWLRCGHHVYVVSTWRGSRAACTMLYHLLLQTVNTQQSAGVSPGQPHLLQYHLNGRKDVEKAVNDLSQAASGGPLYVLIDEMGHEDKLFMGAPKRKQIQNFCEKLLKKVPRLHLWAASCYNKNCPPGWQVEYLTRPLRSPPAVVREVKKDTVITKGVSINKYTERDVPDHTDGPPVRRLRHEGQGHSGDWAGDCVTCGREVASFLQSLRVDVTDNNELTTLNTGTSTTGGTTPPCLQWRDMLVLTCDSFRDNSDILKGLQEAGIPVRVMKDDDIEDVATARSDVVLVARGRDVGGLERKVVVSLQHDEQYQTKTRVISPTVTHCSITNVRTASFDSISRCTSQLVIVESPNYCPHSFTSHR